MNPASWIIRRKDNKEVIAETFSKKIAEAINTKVYEAIPILEYLQSLNKDKEGN